MALLPRSYQSILSLLPLTYVLLFAWVWAAPQGEHKPLQEVTAVLDRHAFQVEVAIEQEDFYRGLMNRTSLSADHGMLFPFSPAKPVSFWMKNTLIPLDMVFIRAQKIRHIVQNALPCKQDPCSTYPSEGVVDMVIELPGGTVNRLHLKPGASVLLYSDTPLTGQAIPNNRALNLKLLPLSAMQHRVKP